MAGPGHVHHPRLDKLPVLRVPGRLLRDGAEQLRQNAQQIGPHVQHDENGSRKISRQDFGQGQQRGNASRRRPDDDNSAGAARGLLRVGRH